MAGPSAVADSAISPLTSSFSGAKWSFEIRAAGCVEPFLNVLSFCMCVFIRLEKTEGTNFEYHTGPARRVLQKSPVFFKNLALKDVECLLSFRTVCLRTVFTVRLRCDADGLSEHICE